MISDKIILLSQKLWPFINGGYFKPLSGGLINSTFLVTSISNEKYVLQDVNPIFPPETTEDIVHVTAHLKEKGRTTLEFLDTVYGLPYFALDNGSLRLAKFISGKLPDSSDDFHRAAGALALFHSDLIDFNYKFKHNRDIHNTKVHIDNLKKSLGTKQNHSFYNQVLELSEKVLNHISLPPKSQSRVVHGDPKLENFLIHNQKAVLLDLDTVGSHTLGGELGDAVRSWCRADNMFDKSLFKQFILNYFKNLGFSVSNDELKSVFWGCLNIPLELTARFLTDSLEESYFSWDPTSFPSAASHNINRAENELEFALSLQKDISYIEDFLFKVGIQR